MVPTDIERARVRRALAINEIAYPVTELDDDWELAAAQYPEVTWGRVAIMYATILLALDNLMMAATTDVSYTEGQSSSSSSDKFRFLERMRVRFQAKLDELVGTGQPLVMWGSMQPTPARIIDVPDDWLPGAGNDISRP